MKNIFACAFLTVLFFSACKKEEDSNCTTDVASLSGTYKVVAATYSAPGFPNTNLYTSLEACEKDDLQILNANGTFTYQDAGTACSPNGTYSGTWSLSGSTITLEGEVGTIQSFDCDRLVIYASPGYITGDKLTTTLEKQ